MVCGDDGAKKALKINESDLSTGGGIRRFNFTNFPVKELLVFLTNYNVSRASKVLKMSVWRCSVAYPAGSWWKTSKKN